MTRTDGYRGALSLLPEELQTRLQAALGAGPQERRPAARAGKQGHIYIYDTIEQPFLEAMGIGRSAKGLIADLESLGDIDELAIHMNTPGGDTFEGFAFYNALAQHRARKTVINEGLTASAGTYIAMAGDRIVMMPEARMMVHEAWGMGIGRAADLRKQADLIESINGSMRDIYVRRTGLSAEEIAKVMADETWFTAQEAVDRKFADEIMRLPSKAKPEAKARAEEKQLLSAYQLAQLRSTARK